MSTASWLGITTADWCIYSDTPRDLAVELPFVFAKQANLDVCHAQASHGSAVTEVGADGVMARGARALALVGWVGPA